MVGVSWHPAADLEDKGQDVRIVREQDDLHRVAVQLFSLMGDGQCAPHENEIALWIEVQVRVGGLRLGSNLFKRSGVRLVPGPPHASRSQGCAGVATAAAARLREAVFASSDFSSTAPKTACHPDLSIASSVARDTVASSLRIDVSRSGPRSLPVGFAGSSIERLAEWSRNSSHTCLSCVTRVADFFSLSSFTARSSSAKCLIRRPFRTRQSFRSRMASVTPLSRTCAMWTSRLVLRRFFSPEDW